MASSARLAASVAFVASLALSALTAGCSDAQLPIPFDHSPATSTTGPGAGGMGGSIGIGGSGGAEQAVVDLVFDPPMDTLTVDGVTPQSASFALKATFEGGATEIVHAESLQFDRPDLASLAAGSPVVLTASGSYAGTGVLHGIFGGKEATATLTVIVHIEEIGAGVDPGAVAKLKEPNLAQDPAVSSLLYPYDTTVFPQGLTSPLLMWSAPSAADVYRVHYEEDNYTFDGFYPITLPASARVPQPYWDKMVASNPGGPLAVELSRWDAASNTAYTSAKQTWTIAPASLRGTIYYWTTSAGGQMARINPGGSWEALNGGTCMGCHAVSADGSTLVVSWEDKPSVDDEGNRAWVSFNLPDMTVRKVSNQFAANVAVSNDGKYVVYGDRTLRLGDTFTGDQIPNAGLDGLPLLPGSDGLMTPAFSPKGKRLAAVEGNGWWYHNLYDGRLVVLDFDPATLKFSNFKGLAMASDFPAGQRALAYPTFSPDEDWIAFHVGDYATGCDAQGCDDAATQKGTIAMQSVSGTAPVELKTLAHGPNKAADENRSFEPTFNPIERGGYTWVVFTSMRDYGNRITGTPNNGKKRLWVAAIDKDPTGSPDPSHRPFFLEGQDESTTNMRGFWTLSACVPTAGGSCRAGFECCSGFCDKGECVTPQDFACVGVGEDCSATSDCCNNSVVNCDGGKCTTTDPK